ncbi:sensor histidine kinase [Caproicibacterium lactatifermentans]|nr:HAMP domain-containing sensor histidine kinase [Caproicibacterium lactatifermentans]MDD4808094.1 HAMP domain-containing sensor histidine kinase [Oscillospiraceae bacterium]
MSKQGKPKSLFKKYLRMTLLTILVSFTILGLVMLLFFNSNWKHEKRAALTKNATSVADMVTHGTAPDSSGGTKIDREALEQFLPALCRINSSDILITDNKGNIMVSGQGVDGTINVSRQVPKDIMKRALAGSYDDETLLGGIYAMPYYVIGMPVKANASSGGQTIGAVFASVAVHSLTEYRKDIFRMFLFAACAAFAVGFCMVWVFSYNMVRPLRMMADAARSFGEGNFSKRVPVTSRDEIGELAVAFNHMAESLATSEYTRRNFIANVSHELKTPMTTIAGFIDGILDGTIPPEKQKHYLRIVSQEVKRLSRLVHTMLDLSHIDNGELKLHPARFDITNTVLTTMLNFEKQIESKRIEVQGLDETHPAFVDGDPDLLHQVIYNLVENAVKFTNPGGYIRVNVREESARTTVTIRNSGEGIASEELGQIFGRFYKTDKSRSKDRAGMGLGLYIVRTIVQQHGGEITARSELGKYSEFSFWLPREIPQQGEKLPTTTVCAQVVEPSRQAYQKGKNAKPAPENKKKENSDSASDAPKEKDGKDGTK